MVERSLSMREAPGSTPGFSILIFFVLFYTLFMNKSIIFYCITYNMVEILFSKQKNK